MAKFLDHHTLPLMSPEQIKSTIGSKQADKFGVTMLNVFMAHGEAWDYSEAPNAEAVVKSHEAMGIKISVKDVTKVSPVV